MNGSTMGEDILIGWLHLIAKVKIMTLSFSFLELLVNVLKNNGSLRTQLPSFVKLKSLKVESYPWISDETVREMVTYLLQNSPPPATFVIGKVKDLPFGSCVFIGYIVRSIRG